VLFYSHNHRVKFQGNVSLSSGFAGEREAVDPANGPQYAGGKPIFFTVAR
jgi:hypothetical protein